MVRSPRLTALLLGLFLAASLAPGLGTPARAVAVQQLVHDKSMYSPIWQLAFLNGVGPRVEESGLGLIAGHAYSAPYEDVKLRAK